MLKRGVSPVIAVVLLILVSIGIGVIIYAFASGFAGSVNKAPNTGILVIEEVIPHGSNGNIIGFDIVLSNPSGTPVVVSNLTALIVGNNEVIRTILVMTEYPLTIPAGGIGKVIMYPLEDIAPGTYYIKLGGLGGEDAVKSLRVQSKVWGGRVVILTLSNDVNNPATTEDSKAWYSAYVEPAGTPGLYTVYFNFTPKPGVTLTYRWAELLSAENNYPIWVGGNPYISTTPITYPTSDFQWWTPVQESEFPVKVVFTAVAG